MVPAFVIILSLLLSFSSFSKYSLYGYPVLQLTPFFSYDNNFEESYVYSYIVSTTKTTFSELNPEINYNRTEKIVSIKIYAPDGTHNKANKVKYDYDKQRWKEMVESICEYDKALYEIFESFDYNVSVAMSLISDEDSDIILYTCIDGKTVYDYAGIIK